MISFDSDFDGLLHDQSFNDQRKFHHQSFNDHRIFDRVTAPIEPVEVSYRCHFWGRHLELSRGPPRLVLYHRNNT